MARHTQLLDVLFAGNITRIFRSMFPAAFVAILLGSILGGIVGEKYMSIC